MEATDLIMKIWGIREEQRAELEETLKTVQPKHLGLSLAMLAQPADEHDINTEAEEWMEEFLPHVRVGYEMPLDL